MMGAQREEQRDKEREEEREAKRRKTVEEAVSLFERMPKKADDPGVKRAFTVELADLVSRMEVSPRFKKASCDYLEIRGRQGAGAK